MHIDQLKQHLLDAGMPAWADCVAHQIKHRLIDKPHGDLPRWQAVVDALPAIRHSIRTIDQGLIQVGSRSDTTAEQRQVLEHQFKQLSPWRKGPYLLHGVMIDTEWRSDWKWDRLEPHVEPLQDRVVLDVGCGNGYHCWRMAGNGARLVIGLDPMAFFHMQFRAVQKMLTGGDAMDNLTRQVWHLPLGIEEMPDKLQAFDTVFSMGVLYHRRSPLDHLITLRDALKPGGQLVLDTLVIEGDGNQVLVPEGRYAKMRNVWFIPSVIMLENWLKRCGFMHIKTIDVSKTTTQEQRATAWMPFESLANFLHDQDHNLTIEGYPAPLRAITLATKPNP